jgi:NAD(P)H-dependent FMN reductase
MPHIAIISSSIRTQRKSHQVASYIQQFLTEQNLGVEILDLQMYHFPLFEERLSHQKDPGGMVLDFAQRVRMADGIIIVTPEYNGGYPASIKNAIDLLTTEWKRKPVAISTVSDGNFGGSQIIVSLQFSLWKLGAWTVPALFPVARIDEVFQSTGIPVDKSALDKKLSAFIRELLWCIEAGKRMLDS